MKKFKDLLMGIIIGGIIFGGIGVTAVTMNADQVKYNPSNENFIATNAKEALDEIYKISAYEIPADTYFYDSKTKGKDIVRYKKVDGKYYLCDQNGKVTTEDEQDVSTLSLIEYSAATNENISSGAAAFASNSFILGNMESSVPLNAVNLGTRTSNAARSFDVSGYDGYENFTVNNFKVQINKISVGNYNTTNQASGSTSISYNSTTGILTVPLYIVSASFWHNNGYGDILYHMPVYYEYTVYLIKN